MLNRFFLLPLANADASQGAVVGSRVQAFLFPFYNMLMDGGPHFKHRFLAFGILVLFSLLAAFLVNFLFGKMLQTLFHQQKKRTGRITGAFRYPLFWYVLLTGIYFSLTVFFFSAQTTFYISRIYFVLSVLLILRAMLNGINVIRRAISNASDKRGRVYNDLLLGIIVPILKSVLWGVGLLFIMDNICHFNVGTLLAGAGVLSMAFAFAAQNTIANLFSAVSLIIDRPFYLGQRIRVDGKDGVVEAIGPRSIRLRALDGTLWCIPNRVVADNPIENVSLRPFHRYLFTLNLTYDTSPEQLERAKRLLGEVLGQIPMIDNEAKRPCITLSELAKYSLDLQVICWIKTEDFIRFSEIKDELNFRILRVFRENGLELAFPTQSIRIEKSEP